MCSSRKPVTCTRSAQRLLLVGRNSKTPTSHRACAPSTPLTEKKFAFIPFSPHWRWGPRHRAFETLRASYRADFWGQSDRLKTNSKKTKLRRRKIDPCAGSRCGSFRRSMRPLLFGREETIPRLARIARTGTSSMIVSQLGRGDAGSLRVANERNLTSIVRGVRLAPRGLAKRVAPRDEPLAIQKNGLHGGAWKKTRLACGRNVSIEEYDRTLLRYFGNEAAETFASGGRPKKTFLSSTRKSMSSVSNQAKPSASFAQFFPARMIEPQGNSSSAEAWHRLNLKEAELWPLGSIHGEEANPHLKKLWARQHPQHWFRGRCGNDLSQATIPFFPHSWKDSAKVSYRAEASVASGVTREPAMW